VYDCLLVTSEGVKRAWTVPAVADEIKQTIIGALEMVVIHRLERVQLEAITDTDDLVRLEVVRGGARSTGH
jgi:hypothetical protein